MKRLLVLRGLPDRIRGARRVSHGKVNGRRSGLSSLVITCMGRYRLIVAPSKSSQKRLSVTFNHKPRKKNILMHATYGLV